MRTNGKRPLVKPPHRAGSSRRSTRGMPEANAWETPCWRAKHSLKDDTFRGRIFGAGELRLEDWSVPVLFQERMIRSSSR